MGIVASVCGYAAIFYHLVTAKSISNARAIDSNHLDQKFCCVGDLTLGKMATNHKSMSLLIALILFNIRGKLMA